MATWLLKTEPDDYAYADLERDGRTAWTGVANPTAQMHLRAVRTGDEALIYHTGSERAIVGLAKVVRGAYEDPDHAGERTAKGEVKFTLIDLAPARAAKTPATLAAIKGDPRFEGFPLVTQGRLGVMPVPEPLDRALRKMAGL